MALVSTLRSHVHHRLLCPSYSVVAAAAATTTSQHSQRPKLRHGVGLSPTTATNTSTRHSSSNVSPGGPGGTGGPGSNNGISGSPQSQLRFASAATATAPKPMTSSTFDAGERVISVQWGDSPSAAIGTYPAIFLRDNCPCTDCMHASSQVRLRELMMWESEVLDEITTIATVQVVGDSAMRVVWGDGHESVYSSEWLRARPLTSDPEKWTQARMSPAKRVHWSSSQFPHDNRFSLPSLLCDPSSLLDFLVGLHRYGVALVTDCGVEDGVAAQIGDKVGLLRETVFGRTWQVRPKANTNSIAYTSLEAPMHVDLPYMQIPPGILMLHCMRPAPPACGGNTYCSDGFLIAEHIRRDDPETFCLLSDVPVTWSHHGHDATSNLTYDFETHYPIIELDRDGNLKQVRLNQVRGSSLNLDANKVQKFYAAMHRFSTMCRSQEYRAELRLEAGEMIVIDNQRLLHGRSALEGEEAMVRCLGGGYMDWDMAHSRIRQLRLQLGR